MYVRMIELFAMLDTMSLKPLLKFDVRESWPGLDKNLAGDVAGLSRVEKSNAEETQQTGQ